MKIYFAGSIRAGREDVDLYQKIISQLKKYGDVLTEHVGDKNLSVMEQDVLHDRFIHDRDMNWLLNSDVVVAEVTAASLGVGYEIGMAVNHNIPVVALFRMNEGKQLSAMINGCREVNVIRYEKKNMDDVYYKIEEYLSHMQK